MTSTSTAPPPQRLWRNNYYLLRHGQSEANVAGLIVSGEEGLTRYGLTAQGRKQATAAAQQLQSLLAERSTAVHVFSSDFLRAFQTAEIV